MHAIIANSGDRHNLLMLIDTVSGILNDLARHLTDEQDIGDVYKPLVASSVVCLKACSTALDRHFVDPDTERLNRDLIFAVMEFLQEWDDWIDALKAPNLKHSASRIFHSFLLRYCKGIVKAWRCWRIDLRK